MAIVNIRDTVFQLILINTNISAIVNPRIINSGVEIRKYFIS